MSQHLPPSSRSEARVPAVPRKPFVEPAVSRHGRVPVVTNGYIKKSLWGG